MSDTDLSTAERLGKFHKELLAQGIRLDVADSLVRDAAHTIVENDGLRVKRDA